MSRGDIFGEMGVLLNQPRSATCVAYEPPPGETGGIRPGPVELVRIPSEVFHEMAASSAIFKAKVESLVTERQRRDKKVAQTAPRQSNNSQVNSAEFTQLGLVQGQSLLLIDLDRCTRCGDCVQACINTHDDGYARLSLDGPRFDRFLVPDTCRKCLNPSCMIGCPVGSIQRGASGEIVVRDWCIGCGMCAQQCPYDAIQMHDVGVIPEIEYGWRYTPASALKGNDWQKPRFRDRKWAQGAAPFAWDLDMQAEVATRSVSQVEATLHEPVCFRYQFRFAPAGKELERFRLLIHTDGRAASAWINGQRTEMSSQKVNGAFVAILTNGEVHIGNNLLAIKIDPPIEENQMVMSVRLDVLPAMGKASHQTATDVSLVTDRAVVCDLCHSVRGGPACVSQCPHDAAFRVDARYEFPI